MSKQWRQYGQVHAVSLAGIYCCLLFLASFAGTSLANEHKFFVSRSAVVFSPRWAQTFVRSPQDYIDVADQYHANKIVWHYPQDLTQQGPNGGVPSNDLIALAQARNYSDINCALPAITRTPAAACKDASGSPILHHASTSAYYPDTNSSVFRNEVLNALDFAKASGCTSLQQDDSWFMYTRRPQGCYANTPPSYVKSYVHSYYNWLGSQIVSRYGGTIPLTYNKKLHPNDEFASSYNELAPHFHGVMAEIGVEELYPERLFEALELVNNQVLDQRTMTTLVDSSPLRNRRAIANVYALGGHPIIPYDVYIGAGNPRYFGPVSYYRSYYNLVRNNPSLFDGHGIQDVYIDHWQNSSGVIEYHGGLTGVVGRGNMMAVLNKDAGGSRVLHILNWQNEVRYFTMWIDKSYVPFVPTTAIVKRPGKADYTVSVVDGGSNRWKLTVSGVDVWAIAHLRP